MVTYEEASPIIEELIKIKSRRWAKSFIAADDIAQEMRIKCIKLLERYDPTRTKSLKSYLNSCTENYLKNLKRNIFGKFAPPCKKRCSHYDEYRKPHR